MPKFKQDSHWRDSARNARFFMWDARAAFPLVLFLMHIRVWSFIVAVVAMMFFAALEHFGFTVNVFLRWLRTTLAGDVKISSPWWKQ